MHFLNLQLCSLSLPARQRRGDPRLHDERRRVPHAFRASAPRADPASALASQLTARRLERRRQRSHLVGEVGRAAREAAAMSGDEEGGESEDAEE